MAMNLETVLKIRADVTGDNEIKGLNDKLKKSATNAGRAATGFNKLKASASGAIGAMRGLLPVIGVAGLAAFAKSNLDAADAMSKLSDRTGIAAPRLDQFRKVAELSDTSIESLGRAFPALSLNMKTAADMAKGRAFEAFKSLGVSLKDVNGDMRDTDDVFLDISDRFKGMADGTEKAALASSIFGTKLGSELIPLLNSGGEAVRNMGTALTQDFADNAAAFNDRLENIQEKFGDLGLTLAESLLPALESLVDVIEPLLDAFTSLPQPLQTLIVSVGLLGGALLILSPVVGPIVAGFTALASLKIGATIAGWLPVLASLAGVIKTVGIAIVGVLSGPVGIGLLIAAVIAAIIVFRDDIAEFFVSLGSLISDFVGTLNSIFVEPLVNTLKRVVDLISNSSAWAKVLDILLSPFSSFIGSLRNKFVDPFINLLIRSVDTLGGSWAALSETLAAPFMATLGFVDLNFVKPILSAISSAVNDLKQFWGALTETLNKPFQDAFDFISDNFVEPIKGIIETTTTVISDNWQALQEGLAAPFTAAAGIIKDVLNSVIDSVENTVNSAIKAINGLIRGANSISGAVGLPTISTLNEVSIPRFADGGVVNGPTMAIVGEGGESEYIVPQSKATGFAKNWLAGRRGIDAIPGFAQGGFVSAGGGSSRAGNATVQITPVFDAAVWAKTSDILISPFNSFIQSLPNDFIKPLINLLTKATDRLGKSWAALGKILEAPFKTAFDSIRNDFVKQIIRDIGRAAVLIIGDWSAMKKGLAAPFMTAALFIKDALSFVMESIERGINLAVQVINRLIGEVNNISEAVGLPVISGLSTVSIPRFADGGVVNGPTMAIVGEGGEPEYIVPQSKVTGFAKNWMAGRRGIGAIPGFAEGGVINAGGGSSGAGNTTVQVTTGPVLQQEGKSYVTVKDLEDALKQFGSQMYKNQQSYGGRRFQGVAG